MENDFLCGLLELQYGQGVTLELQKLSKEVSWAKGWPNNLVSFWNAEAFMWGHKISKETRQLIAQELPKLKNLDLGCGAFSYIPSVGFDISSKMLDFNDNCVQKVQGSLEEELPFSDSSFPSITAIFVLNYVTNLDSLLSNIQRILTSNGTFTVVLSAKNVNEWQKQKQVNSFTKSGWKELLETKFEVNLVEKDGILFLRCTKRI